MGHRDCVNNNRCSCVPQWIFISTTLAELNADQGRNAFPDVLGKIENN